MEYYEREVCGGWRRTRAPTPPHLRSTERRGRAETIGTTRTGLTRAAVRPADTGHPRTRSPETTLTGEVPAVGLIVQKAQKVRRRNRITWLSPETSLGAAVGATAACELSVTVEV